MVNALNRTKVRGVMVFFPFFSGYILIAVTYVTSLLSTEMGILNGFVCNMFFVNVTYVTLFCTAEKCLNRTKVRSVMIYVFLLLFKSLHV